MFRQIVVVVTFDTNERLKFILMNHMLFLTLMFLRIFVVCVYSASYAELTRIHQSVTSMNSYINIV